MILEFIFRWAHVLFGMVWVGMLYYFNFVQTEYFKEAEADAKADAIKKLAPRALWWFRWGAMLTFLTGLSLLHQIGASLDFTAMPVIWIGALAGTLMFLNVWLIIWPNQKIVIASAEKAAAGGEADPAAAGALGKAGLASRTNTLFSIPMLFFMASSVHLAQLSTPVMSAGILSLIVVFGIILALAINGIKGKTGPMTSVKGVIHMGLLLTLILYLGIELL